MKMHSCSVCGRGGCKLWRYASTSCVELHCAECAAKDEGLVPLHGFFRRLLNKDGQWLDLGNELTNSIGNYIPAIPHPTGGWYLGGACSKEAAEAWRALPN